MTTVDEAIRGMIATNKVDTGKVQGLSRQIIAETNSILTGVLLNFEDLPGLVLSSEAFLNYFLQSGPKESLRLILRQGINQKPGMRMKINSAYRTVAQQHILRQIYERGHRNLIPLAARPGRSNHEDGLAIDVDNYGEWKTLLLRNGWEWQGESDPVHFYNDSGRDDIGDLGVKAFQRLWNRHNPNDQMTVDGDFGEQSAVRMNKAPIEGFVTVRIFKVGSTGEVVKRIQQALTNAGFPVPVNGIFDGATATALRKFQDKKGLGADGVAGAKTLKALGIVL
jgi:Putative peptidoglycan binding domain/D-alanyl-D-alanine carboxypeptidase